MPSFVKTRYSGLTGHDDGHHGDGNGLAVVGEYEGCALALTLTCFGVGGYFGCAARRSS
jgi:hypothetical protein